MANWQAWLGFTAGLLGGGACGALLTERFRRRRARTHRIPLIERVNRSPIDKGMHGIRFFLGEGEALTEVKAMHEYQMTLRNTSEVDLGKAQIRFEFDGSMVEPWASRALISDVSLVRIEKPENDSASVIVWEFPQFPSGDTVEFSFRVFEPKSEVYHAVLYNANNMVIERRKDEPIGSEESTERTMRGAVRLITWLFILYSLAGVVVLVLIRKELRDILNRVWSSLGFQ